MVQSGLHVLNDGQQIDLLVYLEFEKRSDMPSRNDQRVAGGNRKTITKCHTESRLLPQVKPVWWTKWARRHWHSGESAAIARRANMIHGVLYRTAGGISSPTDAASGRRMWALA
jgi:hypothetical protein